MRGKLEIEPGGVLYINTPNYFAANEPGSIIIGPQAKMIVTGNFTIGSGAFVDLKEGSLLTLGSGYFNRGIHLECRQSITIGDGCAIGPHVFIQDCDSHTVMGSESVAPVVIGKHVWVGAGAKILKGVSIGDGCVVAAGSVITRSCPAECLLAGVPAKVIRENISWH
jgi:tetrahydrodipicolinate N-succinyltransferase